MKGKMQFLMFPLADLVVLAVMFFKTRHMSIVPELAIAAILAVAALAWQAVRTEKEVRQQPDEVRTRAQRNLFAFHAVVFLFLITVYSVVRYPARF